MKLGIFYTDNRNPHITQIVLQNLQRTSYGVRILVIANEKIVGNPFEEIILNNPVRSHYNIIEKILKGLAIARLSGSYENVSFLEHDVLYPKEYFNLPDFKNCIVNMNYIGIFENGFQEKLPAQLPLHQMHMKFDYAVSHFSSLEKIAKDKSLVIEPSEVERFTSKNPAVHINHGKNFTSHYQCYSTKKIWTVDPYWGDYKKIWQKCIMK